MSANWFERAVGTVSPSWALSRVRSRLVLHQARQIESKLDHRQRTAERFRYEGARAGRRTDGWMAGASDANVELMGALVWLRDRSRDLIRNNPYAVKAVEELVGNTVGTGITPQANTGNADLDRIIDQEWPFFAEKCDPGAQMDFYGMQALCVRTMAESGESIIRFRPRLPQDKLRVPLQLQILEADFLDHARTMGTLNGHVLQGVQFNQIGQRIAYWLYNFHPGGVLILNPRGGILSQPVAADQVMHIYRVLRPGQVRGVPWLAPVMMALRDLDDYADTERVRKKIEACLTAVVTQPETDPALGTTTTDPQTGRIFEEFEPGMVAYVKPGQDVKFNSPIAAGGYREYKVTELQAIASGTGVPYEQIASDMSATTYSSWRGGQLGFRNTIEGYRWATVIPLMCNPAWRRFIDTLILIGKITPAAASDAKVNLYGVAWTAPKWESVDPLKDAKAELQRIRTGTETIFEAIAANGYDPRTQLQKIAQINKELDALKIVLDSDPRQTNLRGAEQPGDAQKGDKNPTEPGRQAKAAADDDDEMILTTRRWDSAVRNYRN